MATNIINEDRLTNYHDELMQEEIGPLINNTNALINSVYYGKVYLGTAAASSSIINSSHYHPVVTKGKPLAITNADTTYIWLVLPESYTPSMLMGGIAVPLIQDSITTINEDNYKVWKSNNTYTGTFNVQLF